MCRVCFFSLCLETGSQALIDFALEVKVTFLPPNQWLSVMKIRAPLPLVLVAVAYLSYLAWQLIVDFTPTVAGRAALTGVLFFFVFRGSRVAGNLLAIFCALSALMLLMAAVPAFTTNTKGAVVFTLIAGLLLAFASYVFFSPAVRAFQAKARLASRPEEKAI